MRDTNSLRVSRSLRDTAFRALVAKEHLARELDRDPSIDEIAREINMPYRSVFFALNATSTTLSLDEVVNEDGNKQIAMMDKLAGDEGNADITLENMMLKKAILGLSERERQILIMRYFQGKTQVEVSREVGISQAQVSRLEKNALDGVKKKL